MRYSGCTAESVMFASVIGRPHAMALRNSQRSVTYSRPVLVAIGLVALAAWGAVTFLAVRLAILSAWRTTSAAPAQAI